MGRVGITRDQVFEAADGLASEGIQPTVKLIRERTGGSFSTITPHLAAWKEERGAAAIVEIPDMPDAVVAATRQMWSAAWRASQDAIHAERDALAAARQEFEKERAELTQEITGLEEDLVKSDGDRQALASQLQEEQARHKATVDKLGALDIEHVRLQERAANTEKRAEELREQVVRLEGDLVAIAKAQTAPKRKSAVKKSLK